MRYSLGWMIVGSLLIAACSNQAVTAPQTSNKPANGQAGGAGLSGGAPMGYAPAGAAGPSENSDGDTKPVPVELGVAKLTPENTKIGFVGTHAGNKPDPRTGGFAKFSGQAEVDSDGKTLKSVSVEIETGSLWTQMPPLTAHLNSPDFFDTREYPAAKFESTSIAAGGDGGQLTITGNLTLLAATREVSFPANVTISAEGVTLKAKFDIDRAEFGMDKLVERVEKAVSLTVVIGEKTQPQQGPGGVGGGRGGPGGGPGGSGGGFDPVAMFKQRDANGDGKLAGDEIPDRMRQDLKAIDTNEDGEITLEEFQARMRQFGGGRPPGGAPGAAPGGAPGATPADGKE